MSIIAGGSGAATLERTVSLYYEQSPSATVANQFQRVINYTVPSTYTATILKFTSYQNDASFSRVLIPQTLGTHNNANNNFVESYAYSNLQFGSICYALVTTAIASGAGSVTYTVTYTNQDGTTGRTGTITIPRNSAVGTQWPITLQAGDFGIRSIQGVSGTPTVAGIIDLVGAIPLAIHADRDSTAQTETIFAPNTLTVAEGSTVVVEFAGSATAKLRVFDILFQLVR